MREVAKRRRAELALHESELKFKAVVESARDGLITADQSGRITFLNRRAEAMFGWPARDALGKRWTIFVPSELVNKYRRAVKRALQDPTFLRSGWTAEADGCRKDGSVFPMELSYSAWRTKSGVAYCGIVRDITVRKQAQQALKASEERFRLMVTNVEDYAIFMLDPQGLVTSWNVGAERIYGYSAGEIVGHHFLTLHSGEDVVQGNPALALREARRTGHSEHGGWRVRKDGSRFFANAILTAIRDDAGRLLGFAKITRDITGRRRSEEAMLQNEENHRKLFFEAHVMQERLRDLSSKVLRVQEEERKHISRELHDDVGAVLMAISVKLEVLRRNGLTRSDNLKKQLREVQTQLREAMEMVHRFARQLRPATLDELGLISAFRAHLKSFAAQTGLQVRFQGNTLAERLNDNQKTVLFRVAQESLTNIAKHARANRVNVSLLEVPNGLCLEVSDNGRSFEAEPQVSGKRNCRLGLLGMQERARLVNGTFSISARPGKGTTVRLVIPVRNENSRVGSRLVGIVRNAVKRALKEEGETAARRSRMEPRHQPATARHGGQDFPVAFG